MTARSQQTEDLTDQRASLEARVRDARADRAGLRARLAKGHDDEERSRLRAALDRATHASRPASAPSPRSARTWPTPTVDLTIEGRKRSGAAVKPGDRWTPGDALGDAGRVLEVNAGVLMIALAVLLPVAVIGVIALLVSRFLRHRRLRALEMA